MSIANIFSIAGSGMSAQSIRLNTVASNIANAETVAGSEDAAYRARYPVFGPANMRRTFNPHSVDNPLARFANAMQDAMQSTKQNTEQDQAAMGVSVSRIIESDAPIQRRYQPQHALADEEGYVYASNVNTMEEMADMISASRSFEMNVEVANTAKSMMQRLITLGQ